MRNELLFYSLSEPPRHRHAGGNLPRAPVYGISSFGQTSVEKSGVKKDGRP